MVRLENRGTGCPSKLTSSWRFANGGEGSLVYDHSLKLLCPDGPCGREVCGHNARCDEDIGHCVCPENYEGNPQDRCFPRIGKIQGQQFTAKNMWEIFQEAYVAAKKSP